MAEPTAIEAEHDKGVVHQGTLPSGEVYEIRNDDNWWMLVHWGSEADRLADRAEGGDWFERSTASVSCDSEAQALAELGDRGILFREAGK